MREAIHEHFHKVGLPAQLPSDLHPLTKSVVEILELTQPQWVSATDR